MIRKATKADLLAMCSLQEEVQREDSIFGYETDSLEAWAERSLEWTFVSMASDRVVGFIHASPKTPARESVFPPNSRVLEVIELLVTANHRRRGLGHGLLMALHRHAREEGFSHLRVYSSAKRFDDMLRFYRRCGFTPWYAELTAELT